MADNFRFSHNARSPKLFSAIVAIYAFLLLAVLVFDAVWWLVACLALPTLPALWDLWRNTQSRLSLDQEQISWQSGTIASSVALNQIDYVRFDTRWDFSVRVTFILLDGRKCRLSPQVLPPHRQFEEALQARGLGTVRHHFRIF